MYNNNILLFQNNLKKPKVNSEFSQLQYYSNTNYAQAYGKYNMDTGCSGRLEEYIHQKMSKR